jgi:hypothetical protein
MPEMSEESLAHDSEPGLRRERLTSGRRAGRCSSRIVEDERTRRGVSVALAVLLVAWVALLWV